MKVSIGWACVDPNGDVQQYQKRRYGKRFGAGRKLYRAKGVAENHCIDGYVVREAFVEI